MAQAPLPRVAIFGGTRSLGLGGDGNVFNGILASRTIGY